MVYGDLYVSGGIDPTYLALEPQPSGPAGFTNPLWVDNTGNLRSEKIKLANGTDTLTLNETSITHSNATNPLTITSNGDINLTSTEIITIGDYTGATTYLYMDIPNQIIDLYSGTGGVALTSPNVISINAQPSGDINIFTAGDIRIGNIGGLGNQNEFNINATKATLKTTNGFQLLDSNIQYPSTYRATGTTLTTASNYAQTFNGTTLIATLPIVDGINVGTQFLITNTNAGNLAVASQSSQFIYSSTGSASATSRTLNTGHSHIFTAIRTTATNIYGWSMV